MDSANENTKLSRSKIKRIFIWLATLIISLVFSCTREFINPLDKTGDLVTPIITSIEINKDKNIEIVFSGDYSDEVEIILERMSNDDFMPIEYIEQSEFILLDTLFDKEIGNYFTYRIQAKKGELTSAYSKEKSIDYTVSELYNPSELLLSSVESIGIKLEWGNRSKIQDSLEIQKKINDEDFQRLIYLPSDNEDYLDTIEGNFDPPIKLTYRIRALNSDLSSKWVENGIEYSGIKKPTNLLLATIKPNGFELVWEDNSEVETGYSLERKKDDADFQEIATLGSNQTEYLDNITESGHISYRVRAIKNSLYSPYSDTLTFNSSISAIDFGDVVTGVINSNGEIAIYKFSAEIDDIVLIQAISGDIHTRFELYDPEGILVYEGGAGGWLRYRSQKLPKSGTYTLFVLDHGANNTGSYDLTIQRVNNPPDPQIISLGEIINDRIDNHIELEVYTFDVAVDDVVLIQSTTSQINTRYELYDSEGILLYEGGNGGWLRYRTQKITKADQYSLLVMDNGGNNTGSYELTIQRVNNPTNSQAIAFGDIVSDRIDQQIELEVYTFDVAVDDVVLIHSTTSQINTRYELYDSEGILLYEGGNGGWLRYRTQKITKADQYSLLVMDHGGNNTGSYELTIQRVNNPTNSQAIAFGDIVSDRIDQQIELEVYTFDVAVDDVVLIHSTTSQINTRYELYDSEGILLYEGGNGGWLRYRTQKLTKADQYSLLVMDNGGNNTGSYELTIQRVNNPTNSQAIAFGDIVSDRIDQQIELEVYTFDVAVDDVVLIYSTTSQINTRYELYDSEGILLYEGGNGGWLRYRTQKISKADQYSLLVMDNGGNNTGSYELTFQRANNPINSQAISFGDVTTGYIDQQIELQAYTFTTVVNDVVLIQAIGNSIHTRFELYDSEGRLVYEGGNGGWLRYRSSKLIEGGQYTLLVMDNGGNNTGSFDLTIQRLNNAGNAAQITISDSLVFTTSLPIEIKALSFEASSSMQIQLEMGRNSGSITPRIEFYNPEGVEIYSGSASSLLNSGVMQLSDPGTYTILSMDQSANGTGTFYFKVE